MSTIYLISPISGHGHLDAYSRLYSRALLELGHRVVLIAPEDGGTKDYLGRAASALVPRFYFVSSRHLDEKLSLPQIGSRAHLPMFQRAKLVFGEEGVSGIANRVAGRGVNVLNQYTPSLARRLGVDRGQSGRKMPFSAFAKRIELAQKMTGLKGDLALFLYLDIMGEDRRDLAHFEKNWDMPWGGILFHARNEDQLRQTGPERYFSSSSMRGAKFLVPETLGTYRNYLPALDFVLIPDVADVELSAGGSDLIKTIRSRAGDRCVVLQIGTIAPHKGTLELLNVMKQADPSQFFFAVVGRPYFENFNGHADILREAMNAPPDNVLFHPSFIDDERDYNAILQAADVIYAVYRDFPASSNVLTKAAYFGVPILVSDRHLMGERVRRYQLGATVQEGDTAGICQSLWALKHFDRQSGAFLDYAADHSLDALKKVLGPTVELWRSGGTDGDIEAGSDDAEIRRTA